MIVPILPDSDYFASCVTGLQCSEILDETKLEACVDIDSATTVCNGSTLHACCAATHRCNDINCPSTCSALGYAYDHCGMDTGKGHAVCFCR